MPVAALHVNQGVLLGQLPGLPLIPSLENLSELGLSAVLPELVLHNRRLDACQEGRNWEQETYVWANGSSANEPAVACPWVKLTALGVVAGVATRAKAQTLTQSLTCGQLLIITFAGALCSLTVQDVTMPYRGPPPRIACR